MLGTNFPTICILAGFAITGWAQLAPPAREIPLYPGVAPGSENWNYPEITAGTPDQPQAQNIVRPVLLYYPAEKANAVGTAMIVAPGGGFRTLMMSYEGVDVAKRLNQMGVDAFVLKYRTTYVDPDAPAPPRPVEGRPPRVRKRAKMSVRWRAPMANKRCGCCVSVLANSACFPIESASSAIRPEGRWFSPPCMVRPMEDPILRPRSMPPVRIQIRPRREPRRYSSRSRRMTLQSDSRDRSICLARGEKRGCPPNCTSSRPASTASERRAAERITTWTA